MRGPGLHFFALATGLLLAGAPLPGRSQEGGTVHAEEGNVLKAKFLAKVCAFVDWPPTSTVPDLSRPFVIGILPGPPIPGEERWEDSFVRAMREVFGATPLKQKKVILRNIASAAELKECQAVYVMPRARIGIPNLVRGTRPLHTLLFAQSDGFADLGVHLNFLVVDRHVRFEINEASFQDSGLKVDSLILRTAIVVKRREGKP